MTDARVPAPRDTQPAVLEGETTNPGVELSESDRIAFSVHATEETHANPIPSRSAPPESPNRSGDTMITRRPRGGFDEATERHRVPARQDTELVDDVAESLDTWTRKATSGLRSLWASLSRALTTSVQKGADTFRRMRGVKEFEQRGDDKFDRQRARQWESFNRGRTSSSYLQDTDSDRK